MLISARSLQFWLQLCNVKAEGTAENQLTGLLQAEDEGKEALLSYCYASSSKLINEVG